MGSIHPINLKQLSLIFIMGNIDNFNWSCKNINITLLVLKNIQDNYFSYQVHLLDFCLLHYSETATGGALP